MRYRLKSGLSIRYKTRGIGPTMLLLHPVGLTGDFWDAVIARLETEFRLIAPDARGHGESDVPSGPFGLDDLADDAIELLRAVGAPPAFVVGCSMGGMTAQGIALKAPELLRGVVSANTTHTRDEAGRAMIEKRALAAEKGMPGVIETTITRWFDEAFRAVRPDVVGPITECLLSADPIAHAWAWRAIRDLAYGGRLREVTVPALAIAGTTDRSASPDSVRKVAEAFGNGRFYEIDAGHLAPVEKPDAFAAALRDFARSIA
ncbi:alpha/beta fold hydrolase [Propylenella binzhouense]|uniref:Alpha/beta fold hydrolase n=1 Tax=Propylenella binzhouense TaxID=2555902 RepID=A0A964WU20_9HYPH|nr:alpha/beta fold hydrolase [Propylenella binzhouense]MYZ48591.1 alpha/beta fold hydrolase [Propylenella binzhouense]